MKNLKIGIIGAGSAVFSIRIISDLCKIQELSGTHVVLMDVDKKRLENVLILAKELTNFFNARITFSTVETIKETVEGADFVINTAMAGGHNYLELVRAIGEKYGYYRGVDAQNFNFVSDYLNLTNWNQFALFLKIAKTIERLSPNAWYLQAANPVFEGTTLVSNEVGIKMVGFCHGHHAVETIAQTIGEKQYEWQVGGVNHGIWLTKFVDKDGKDLYQKLNEHMKKVQYEEFKPSDPFDDQLSPVAWEMYKFYGLFPVGDTVRNSTWKYHRDLQTKIKWYGAPWGGADSEIGWKWYVEQLNGAVHMIDTFVKLVTGGQKLTALKTGTPLDEYLDEILSEEKLSGEQHVPFINSVVNKKCDRFVVNVLNKGKIKDLDYDIAVEICANVCGENIEFEETKLSERVVNWYLKPRILLAKQALEAFKTQDVKLIADILERDPRTKSSEQIEKLIGELYPVVISKMKEIESQQ
ncbi:alpha-glucosidase AglA [Fervidobacterium gondwanense]|uniref:Alpha-galactosidase n=1 Tax=Fervidobacterium gondwanense DSM 13020 TaxID=1121883 RepID=A0A1M7SIS5_FERGO|nr:alpha-glucosidase AglA [Fervidobacterium gondwanense]SHN58355.1 alpha-galactosidase [Fervidobacterium gondwanense DSM 13020]